MRKLEVCFSPAIYPLFKNDNAIVVVIDVLRATSAICTAFHFGVKKMIPVASLDEAAAYKAKKFLVAAERNAEIIPGYDFGNSPYSYMTDKVNGETIVITTTNGTQAIHAARDARQVVVGSFLNLSVLASYLTSQESDVLLLCAGWKNKLNLEDSLFAGALASELLKTGSYAHDCDSTRTCSILYKEAKPDVYGFLNDSSHRQRLAKLDLEKDVRYCLQVDKAPVIPVLKDEFLVKMDL
jgi:2-phosphosulfolactate phosphatase